VAVCRRGGFRKITLRGDTDFTQTEHLDRWDEDGVQFVFGIDAMPNLYEIAEKLPENAWRRLQRRPVLAATVIAIFSRRGYCCGRKSGFWSGDSKAGAYQDRGWKR
jgi:hypothetical protein